MFVGRDLPPLVEMESLGFHCLYGLCTFGTLLHHPFYLSIEALEYMCTAVPSFRWSLGTQTQVLMLVWQALFQLSHQEYSFFTL